VANPSTQAPAPLGRSLTVTRKGQVTLRKELLADRSSHRASLDELNGAAASGWADLPAAGPKA
jgi:hypothetical protein